MILHTLRPGDFVKPTVGSIPAWQRLHLEERGKRMGEFRANPPITTWVTQEQVGVVLHVVHDDGSGRTPWVLVLWNQGILWSLKQDLKLVE